MPETEIQIGRSKVITEADFLEYNIQALICFLGDPTMFLTEDEKLQNETRLRGLKELRPLYSDTTITVERSPFPGYPIASYTDHSQKPVDK